MAKSKKSGLNLRRKNALKRLEASYETFKKEHKDKPSTTSANGKVHPFRKYDAECSRMSKEMETLKKRIH